MNCFKCKHYEIKWNGSNILESDYCKKFGCYTKTLKEKIETEKIECCEPGENWLTEWSRQAAESYGLPERFKK